MRAVAPEQDRSPADLGELVEPLRRYTRALVRDPHDAEDVVQETLANVLAARDRLDLESTTGYAFAVARNLVRDQHRTAVRRRRHLPRLVDRSEPEQPDQVLIAQEERRALRAALDRLPPEHRRLMLAHEVEGQSLQDVAGGRSAGAAAAQLARARARLRLDYLLSLRRVELPTDRCRPVLLAMSAGDRRRQAAVHAGQHVVSCRTCAELAPALVHRERALAGWLPWVWGGTALAALLHLVRKHPVVSGAAATAVAGGTAVVLTASGPAPQPLDPQPALSIRGRAVAAMTPAELASLVGEPVRADRVRVLDVPADEGFWVGRRGDPVWVQLRVRGESRMQVEPGERLTFVGELVSHGDGFIRRLDLPREDHDRLQRLGTHVSVAPARISVGLRADRVTQARGVESGTTVVVVPGLCVSAYLRPFCDALALAGHQVLKLDPPGWPRTPPPLHEPGTLGELARPLVDTVVRLDIRDAVLVGQSVGAQLAAHLAAAVPERVRCLVLQGPTFDPRWRTLPRAARRLARDFPRERPSLLATEAPEWLRVGLARVHRMARLALDDRLEETLATYDGSVAVLVGDRDTLSTRAWTRSLATSPELHVVIPALPHSSPHAAPVALAAAVNHLSRLRGR